MKILIIGGTHFMGPYVVHNLHAQGHEVILFHRNQTSHAFPFPVQHILGDRAHLFAFKQQLDDLALDVVIDMVAFSENDAQQVVKTFSDSDTVKRVIVISSCDVYLAYGNLHDELSHKVIPIPLTENSELRTLFYPYRELAKDKDDWQYNYEKILVEKVIRGCSGFSSTILRLPMVYGPNENSRIAPYLELLDQGKSIELDEDKAMWRSPRGYVEDMAKAITLAALDLRSSNFIYNISQPKAYSEREWISLIAKVAGHDPSIITRTQSELPESLNEHLNFKQDLVLDSTLIRQGELHYTESCSVEETIEKCIEGLRKKSFRFQK